MCIHDHGRSKASREIQATSMVPVDGMGHGALSNDDDSRRSNFLIWILFISRRPLRVFICKLPTPHFTICDKSTGGRAKKPRSYSAVQRTSAIERSLLLNFILSSHFSIIPTSNYWLKLHSVPNF